MENNHHFRVLVDEGANYWIGFLERNVIPFEAVWKINLLSEIKLKTDYSILRYAWKNRMTIITTDKEMAASCNENRIPNVWVGGSGTTHVTYLKSANRLNKKIYQDIVDRNPTLETKAVWKLIAEKHILLELRDIEASYESFTWVNPTLGY